MSKSNGTGGKGKPKKKTSPKKKPAKKPVKKTTRKKKPNPRNRQGKYSEQERLLYAIAYLTYGNFNRASKFTGIPASTAKSWKEKDTNEWDRLILKAGQARENFTSSEEADRTYARIKEMIEGMVLKGAEASVRVIDKILSSENMKDADQDRALRAFGIFFDKFAVITGIDKHGMEDASNPYHRFQDRLADRCADLAGDDQSMKKTGNGKLNLNATVKFKPVPPNSRN